MATAKKRSTSEEKTLVTDLQAAAKEGKKKLAAALRVIAKLRGQGTESYDELWEQVRDVLEAEPPLWRHGDYKHEADFIRRELPGETARSVRRNILVASCFTPKDEADKGISFLEELALYAQQRAGASKRPAAIDIDRMFVAIPSGKLGTVRKRARDASVQEVRKARRALRTDGATGKAASKQEKALRAAIAKAEELASVSVAIRGGQASFAGVPFDQKSLRALGKTLATIKL